MEKPSDAAPFPEPQTSPYPSTSHSADPAITVGEGVSTGTSEDSKDKTQASGTEFGEDTDSEDQAD